MNILNTIASKLKGHDCEKMVRRIGNEISLTLPNIAIGTAKMNIGIFSNKIVEIINASNIAVTLDNSQYLICKAKNNSNDEELKIKCERISLQIILALTQLESIFETIKMDPNLQNRKELSEWIKYCSSLNKHAIEAISPGSSQKGYNDFELDDIMRYQNITEDDIQEALKELKK